jgi:hypothetical protein
MATPAIAHSSSIPLNWSVPQKGVAGGTGALHVPETHSSPLQQFPCPLPLQCVGLSDVMQLLQVALPPPEGTTQIGAEAGSQQSGGVSEPGVQVFPEGMLHVHSRVV